MALITLSDIAAKHEVSSHAGIKATNAIENAERLDLKPLLGEKLFLDMVANSGTAPYPDLLNGGAYTYDGFEYNHVGIKSVLCEFAYARLVFFGSESASPHGLIDKMNRDAQHISRDRKKELYTASRGVALELWEEVRRYLVRNASLFEYWDVCDTNPNKVSGWNLKHIR